MNTAARCYTTHLEDARDALQRRDYADARRCLRWAMRHARKLSSAHVFATLKITRWVKIAQARTLAEKVK